MIGCMIKGCGNKAKWQVCARAWAQGASKETSGPALIESAITICDQHKENPPTSASGFFTDEARKLIQETLSKTGRPPLDFESMEYVFAPVTEKREKALAEGKLGNLPPELLKGISPPDSIDGLWSSFNSQVLQKFVEHIAESKDKEFAATLHSVAQMCFTAGASAVSTYWADAEQHESDEERKKIANRLQREGNRLMLGQALMHSLGGQVAHA